MDKQRIEADSIGQIKVDADKLWGAATQRSLENFNIGSEKMPPEIIESIVAVKRAAALSNGNSKHLPKDMVDSICSACEDILLDGMWDQFPLSVWQTGSGTQTNMNVNEVIANLARRSSGLNVHPNDHVNMHQSTNDVFPSAIHIAAYNMIEQRLIPSITKLCKTLRHKSKEYKDAIKIGRTHLQDATPVTFGQEAGAWASAMDYCVEKLQGAAQDLLVLPIGGTAVGTGLNSPKGFGDKVCYYLNKDTGYDFCSGKDKFHGLSFKDRISTVHGALEVLAEDLNKIANDIRWLSGGPDCGLGEINIPENEPGSSIMPGKVNPTQCEAVTMVYTRVIGNGSTISAAAASGNFQLNVYMPVIAYSLLQSIDIMADVIASFESRCVIGIKANKEKMLCNAQRSLMLITCLTPLIGYESAARAAKKARTEGISLKEATLSLELCSEREFDRLVRPASMLNPF